MQRAFGFSLLLVVAAVLSMDCLGATSVRAVTWADADFGCRANTNVALVVAADLHELADRLAQGAVSSTKRGCASGLVGDAVITPPGDLGGGVAFAVLARDDGQAPDRCGDPTLPASERLHCVVAKRALRFRPHEPVDVRVDLRASCLDVRCGDGETCTSGRCTNALVPVACSGDCGESNLAASSADPSDPGTEPCTNAPTDVTFAEVATTTAGKAYKVTYEVDGTKRLAQVCVPSSPGPHPILVVHHGGVVGLESEVTDRTFCNLGMSKGYVTLEPQLRGESDPGFGSSAGSIEFCHGEAIDVIELLKIARHRCDVDPKRVGALGFSHGGCVALQLAARGVALKALVDIGGPTHVAPLYDYHVANRASGGPVEQKVHNDLADKIPLWVGATPSVAPRAYDERSPVLRAGAFAKTPMLIIHGAADYVIPRGQSCELREALVAAGVGFVNLHVNAAMQLVPDQVPSCGQATYTTALPSSYPADHYFAVFDGQAQAFDALASAATLNTLNLFLDAHL